MMDTGMTNRRDAASLVRVTGQSSDLVVRLHVDLMRVCGMRCLAAC